MEREILFRGKKFGTNDWIEGYFIRDWDLCYIYWSGTKVQVNPKTIGQFTGLTDKNRKKIFEGDIIAPCVYKKLSNYQLEVVYNNGGFGLKAKKPFLPQFKYLHEFANRAKTANTEIEVIGNIHDNPELLTK